MRLRSSSDTCLERWFRGANGRHRRSLWLAGQCGLRGEGRGTRFLRYGAGQVRFLDDDEAGSGVFQARRSWLTVGGE